jgi:hypothetical protein
VKHEAARGGARRELRRLAAGRVVARSPPPHPRHVCLLVTCANGRELVYPCPHLVDHGRDRSLQNTVAGLRRVIRGA